MSESIAALWKPPRSTSRRSVARRGALILGLASLCAISLSGGCAADAGAMDNNNNNSSCNYSIDVSPYSPRVGDAVELSASWVGPCTPQPSGAYQWTLTGPNGVAVPFATRQGGRFVDWVPSLAGAHFVELTVQDIGEGPVHLSQMLTVVDPAGLQQTYLLRLTPPMDSTAPRQQRVLVVTGGTPISDRVVTLDDGVLVQNTLTGPSGPFAGYLRLVESGFALYRELHVPSTGQFSLPVLPDALYDVTVVPDGAEPAPAKVLGQDFMELRESSTFLFDAGVPVVGYVEDHQGNGVGQAQAVLRSGELSSSMGTSDAFDGRFILWSRPGPQGLEVAPREGVALPRVRLPEGAGISLDAAGGLSLRLRYQAVETASVSLTVTAGDVGSEQPVPGARVTLEATDLGRVGTVTVTQDGSALAPLDAPGSFRVMAITDAAGALPALLLPVGRYRVIIEAPLGTPEGFGSTVVESLTLAGGASQVALSLAPPAALEGHLVDDLFVPVEGARVVAVTKLGVGSAVETTTDAEGFFSLPAIRGAAYSLLLHPPSDLELARKQLGPVLVGSGDVTSVVGLGPAGAVVLARGLRVDGVVVHGASGLAGVLVQAIPLDEPSQPVLAESVTDSAGGFSMVVPDPGILE